MTTWNTNKYALGLENIVQRLEKIWPLSICLFGREQGLHFYRLGNWSNKMIQLVQS